MNEDEYCDFCETEGHTFGSCPERDDDVEDFGGAEDGFGNVFSDADPGL